DPVERHAQQIEQKNAPLGSPGERRRAAERIPGSDLFDDAGREGKREEKGHPDAVGDQAGNDQEYEKDDEPLGNADIHASRQRAESGGENHDQRPGGNGKDPDGSYLKEPKADVVPAAPPDGLVGVANGDGLAED